MDPTPSPGMRILVLTKRQYTGKDLLDDRFGRIRELPLELAKLGHEVVGLCLSYRPKDEATTVDRDSAGGAGVTWHSRNLGKSILPGLIKHARYANTLIKEFRPELIWACSDSLHAILGVRLGKRTHTKCVVDLYDNFESFGATRLPGVRPLFKRAVRAADGVTCASQRLADLVVQNYRRVGPVTVLENAVRPDLFFRRDRVDCRRRLGLPENVTIIGTAGALSASRGIDVLFRGFELLAAKEKNLHLAIAGARDRGLRIPSGPRVHDLGILPLDQVPILFNALDVAVVCNRDSAFGRYSFPQKAYEILACRTRIVAAAVGTMSDLLASHAECLFEPDSPESLAQAIRRQLANPTILDLQVPTWSDTARKLEKFLGAISKHE
jgi:teichuronic acid biosynthesis glycosyltransferase TuaC